MKEITSIYSPDPSVLPTVNQMNMASIQQGSYDCGLFALAYALELALYKDPSTLIFDQTKMRGYFMSCLEKEEAERFPTIRRSLHPATQIEITKLVRDTNKWSFPKQCNKQTCPYEPEGISLQNRFAPLNNDTFEKNIRKRSPRNKENIKTFPSESDPFKKKSSKSTVYNLSNRILTKDESNVLELGLSFCPSQANFNKETFANDIFKFFRRLKLREYFFEENGKETSHLNTKVNSQANDERHDLGWFIKNEHWYPEKVREGRSTGLSDLLDNTVHDIRSYLISNKSKRINNLTNKQREALNSLASDETLIIKPADKGSGIVLMDINDYNELCMKIRNDKEYYEEVTSDPNPDYRKNLDSMINEMKNKDYITEVEDIKLREGNRTPCFYGLPKIHKQFNTLPPLRPICSGYNSCTAKVSEWVDSFIKPAAMKTNSYIKDTTDFIKHIEKIDISAFANKGFFLVTMDVCSLYPNIDHEEGVNACKEALEQRKDKSIPSDCISNIINFILKSNTLTFMDKFHHQLKGTAMGTPMAVNFANLFMSKFETEMLDAY